MKLLAVHLKEGAKLFVGKLVYLKCFYQFFGIVEELIQKREEWREGLLVVSSFYGLCTICNEGLSLLLDIDLCYRIQESLYNHLREGDQVLFSIPFGVTINL